MTANPQQMHKLLLDHDTLQMETTDAGKNARRISMVIPAREVKRVQKKLKKMNQDPDVKELSGRLQKECLEWAISKVEPNSIWGPHLPEGDSIAVIQKEKPLAFAVMIDDMPELQWPDWADVSLTRPVNDITQEMLDAEMDEQCLLAGTPRPRQGSPRPGDMIKCNLKMDIEDAAGPAYQTDGIQLRVPQPGQPVIIEGLPVPGFEQHLEDVSADEVVTIDIMIPQEHPAADLRGKTAVLSLELLEINEIVPATVEDVVARYESPSEKALRNQIRSSLEAKARRDQNFSLTTQLFEQLIEMTEFDIPDHVLSTKLERRMNQERREAHNTAITEAELEARIAANRDEWLKEIEDKSRKQAISLQLTRHLRIGISETLIAKQINEMALDLGQRPEDFRKKVVDDGQINFFANLARQFECLEHLRSHLTIVDMPADEWSKQQVAG